MRTQVDGVPAGHEASYPRITPEMVASETARIGKELRRPEPYIESATRDAIRHWARGIGDMNPLWTDREYADSSVWGDIIATPTLALAMVPNGSSGFRGIHGWHKGCSLDWLDVIKRGQTFDTRATLEDLQQVKSQYVNGLTYDQTIRTDLTDHDTGALVCIHRTFIRRFERTAGRETAKYRREKQSYTRDELKAISERYASETIRGAEPRRLEDVSVGDQLPEIMRGPLTIADCVAFVTGWGGAYVMAHGFAWEFLRKHPGAFPPDESNVPDSPERTHWVDAFAQAIGAPAAFDYGPQRIAWCGTLVTNWMSDAGILRHLTVKLLRPNYHGDCVTISGTVTSTDPEAGRVTVTFEGKNQLDERVAEGHAIVELPRRPAATHSTDAAAR